VTRNQPVKTLLVVSQVYVPDPASVGQHMADAAAEMAKRGWRVVVLTANRGYADPSMKYPARETLDGVEIRRLPFCSFGKKTILLRLIGGVSFLIQVILRALFMRRLSCMLVSTSPPLCPVSALVIAAIRRVPIKYWVMDLNPDQMVALGHLRASALPVRLFNWLNRRILTRASDVIALDRFMAKRLIDKAPGVESKLAVIPPWPHDEHLDLIEHQNNPFRAEHHLDGKLVIMFSGNLSIASPVDTVLEAAMALEDLPGLVFMFVGGGLGKKKVDELIERHRPAHIVSLPYQPLSQLKYSLSAADVHLVTMGDEIVGICHPCKVYGAMAVGRPILWMGPEPCHISDMFQDHPIGWHIRHGDAEAAKQTIREIFETDRDTLAKMGASAQTLVADRYSKAALCGAFCDVLERGIHDTKA